MRRWNGWGDDSFSLGLPRNGEEFLAARIGHGIALQDVTLASVCAKVPQSRLGQERPAGVELTTDAETRVRHARGQSLPDWLAMRSGQIDCFPDAVAFPRSSSEVRELLAFASANSLHLIPYGGGTSVTGHINPLNLGQPVITVSMAAMNRLLDLDPASQIATFGAGTPGPQVEAQLRAHGFTLGHFPQSFELSTIGGWVASRSSGQQSLRYGRIEQLFAGGTLEAPVGTLELPDFPASSAGPDLRELVLGSEGRLGIITKVKVRVSPLPQCERFQVAFFPSWAQGRDTCRELAQQRVQLSMLRLSNAEETRTQLALAGHERAIKWLQRVLAMRGADTEKCMMTFGVTGSSVQCRSALRQARRIARRFGGVYTGTLLGKKWEAKRFTMPYLREALWQKGYVVDTLETATNWSNVDALMNAMEHSLRSGLNSQNEAVHVFTHLSHVYGQGCSLYTTYVFRAASCYATTLDRWKILKHSTSELIVRQGGTISHQHGVGKDHAPYLLQEKGALAIQTIQHLCQGFDPQSMMNPGTLVSAPKKNEGAKS